jgi:DNA invertase Pin-like site-specific DNA recombinase
MARGRPTKRRALAPAAAGPVKCIGYIRVSDRGGRSGPEYHTLELQEASIRACAQRKGWELTEILTEENKSGADASRAIWREVMARVEAGEVKAVAVWKVSRFSRSLSDAVLDINDLEEVGADIAAGDEPFDTSSPQGRLMMHMLLAMAEYEREILGEQFEAIRARVFARGAHLGAVPFGYHKVRNPSAGAARRVGPKDVTPDKAREILRTLGSEREPVPGGLVPHPIEAPIVQEVFERRRDGASVAELQRYLDSVAYTPGKAHWMYNEVLRMLSLRTHLGEVSQHRRDEHGAIIEDRIHADAHEAIISPSLFREVQTTRRGPVKRAQISFLLSGLVYCASCSYTMGGNNRSRKVTVGSDGSPLGRGRRPRLAEAGTKVVQQFVRVYKCPGKRGTGRCAEPSVITAGHLERIVWERADRLRQLVAEAAAGKQPDLDRHDQMVEEAEEALRELSSVEARRLLGADWMPQMVLMRQEKDLRQAERDKAYEQASFAEVAMIDWEALDEDIREKVLRSTIQAVFVRKLPRGADPADRVHVVWAGDETPTLGGPGNRIVPTRFAFPDADSRAGMAAGE